jgi:hypothetical protein
MKNLKEIPAVVLEDAKKHFEVIEQDGKYLADVSLTKEYLYKQLTAVAHFKMKGERMFV